MSASLGFAKAKLIAILVCLTTVTGAVTVVAEQLAKPPAPPAAAPITFVTTAPSTQSLADSLAVLIYSAGFEAQAIALERWTRDVSAGTFATPADALKTLKAMGHH